jgi:hypothetical protein
MLASVGVASQRKPERHSDLARMDLLLKQTLPSVPSTSNNFKRYVPGPTRSTRTSLNQSLTDDDFFSESPTGAAALDYDESLDPIHAGILSSEEAETLFEL